jgi:hypothetical protein
MRHYFINPKNKTMENQDLELCCSSRDDAGKGKKRKKRPSMARKNKKRNFSDLEDTLALMAVVCLVAAPVFKTLLVGVFAGTLGRKVSPMCSPLPARATLALFVWLIGHQPKVLFSQNKSVSINQPVILFSHNKPAPAISHQPNEHVVCLLFCGRSGFSVVTS